ncbi:MAG: hypothetical protein ABFC80_04105 [Coriobacteriales bacterium]
MMVSEVAQAYGRSPDEVMRWAWLDVSWWARLIAESGRRRAMMEGLALTVPEPEPEDRRTPDEIWASVLAAEAKGWQQ